jgi:DNA polymerase/3'-5' exonuclease PolX
MDHFTKKEIAAADAKEAKAEAKADAAEAKAAKDAAAELTPEQQQKAHNSQLDARLTELRGIAEKLATKLQEIEKTDMPTTAAHRAAVDNARGLSRDLSVKLDELDNLEHPDLSA